MLVGWKSEGKKFCLLVLNVTFNNISVISWRSVLLVEDPEKTTDAECKLNRNQTKSQMDCYLKLLPFKKKWNQSVTNRLLNPLPINNSCNCKRFL